MILSAILPRLCTRRKPHFCSANIEHCHHISQKRSSQDEYTLTDISASIDSANTGFVSRIIHSAWQYHIRWIDVECRTPDHDTMNWRCRITIHHICPIVIIVNRWRNESRVDGVRDGGWIVVERCARVNL